MTESFCIKDSVYIANFRYLCYNQIIVSSLWLQTQVCCQARYLGGESSGLFDSSLTIRLTRVPTTILVDPTTRKVIVTNKTKYFTGTALTAGFLAGVAALTGAMPANAADASCLVHPAVHHDAVSHPLTTTTPGSEEVSHLEQRWTKDAPAVIGVSHKETQYSQLIKGHDAVTHDQWKYKDYVKGKSEISHSEWQFSRQNPGQSEKSHSESQVSRMNPGQSEKSHQVFKYQQNQKQYQFRTRIHRPDNTVERKFVTGYDFVSGGTTKVNGYTIPGHWVQSAGWHQIPDVVINAVWGSGGVPSNLLGGSATNPKGNVPLSTYGGPNASVQYYASMVTITGGYTDWSGWSDWTTTNPGAATDTQDVATKTVTLDYKGGAWTTDTPGAPWVKTAEEKVVDQAYIAPFKEYLEQDGVTVTTDASKAGWFKTATIPTGWTAFGTPRTVIDQAYVAPFKEYRAQDGSATPNSASAGWFSENMFTGWNQEGDPKKVITQAATDDVTYYLTRDDQGNLGRSTNAADASLFTSSTSTSVDTSVWSQYGRTTVTDESAVPDKVVYLTESSNGTLGQTDNVADASWVNTTLSVPPIWQQMVDEHGDPLVRTIVDTEAVPGYPTYYVHGGKPTLVLGDSNWTTDKPEGWNFVDDRKVVDKVAVPPTTVTVTIVDKAAYTDPATYTTCAPVLASTGSDPSGPAGFGILALGLGATLLATKAVRARHRKENA